MPDDVCLIDLTGAPYLRKVLNVCTEAGLTENQFERIAHRLEVVHSLTREVERSTDQEFIQRANWMIELKRHEIVAIASEEVVPTPDDLGQSTRNP